MKKYIYIFLSVLVFDCCIQIIDLFYNNSIVSFFKVVVSLPLSLIDRSYPYYAEGTVYFGLFLTISNTLLQSILILVFINSLKNKNK